MNPASQKQFRRLALDLGPLVVFFAAFKFANIYVATGLFMAAVLVSLAVGYWFERKISPMPAFTAVLVLVFGGLTLYLHNDVFIKVKLTILYTFFGVILLGGLAVNRLFIKYVFGQAFELTEEGWRKLTLRWGLFAFAIAIINEIVWRHFSTDVWVNFKVWGIYPLFFLFALAQTPLILKHEIEQKKD
ncbi:MAG TPA: septation protein A [Rhizomicrobium sp.]|nr:septation protein A [Rhizomicrobium sp.]